MPAQAHIQAATLTKFLDAWKKWDATEWLATFSEDFEQVSLPFSMGLPPRTRAEVDMVLPKLMKAVTNYELDVHEIVHDPERNRAAVYTVSSGDLPWETNGWRMDYAAFVTFSKAGDKIARVEEMLDSAFMADFGPKFQQYLKEQGGMPNGAH